MKPSEPFCRSQLSDLICIRVDWLHIDVHTDTNWTDKNIYKFPAKFTAQCKSCRPKMGHAG